MRIVLVGVSGFPFGLAAIKRQELLAKSLLNLNNDVLVVCNRSVHSKERSLQRVGRYNGIKYIYLFGPYRNPSFLVRNFQKLMSPLMEFLILAKINKKKKVDFAIISNSNSFKWSIVYFVYARLIRLKSVVSLVEIYRNRKSTPFLKRINNFLFNNLGYKLFDAYLPISSYIISYYKLSGRKYLKLPIVVDTSKFDAIRASSSYDYFMYCGAAAYYDAIEFILESYLKSQKKAKLVLVVNGDLKHLNMVACKIDQLDLKEHVVVLKNLNENELYRLYKESIGLLLPLFDTIQDKARFPHKLAEYLSSGTVILTNSVGELPHYLENKLNVLFTPINNIIEYSKMMDWILNNKEIAQQIGNNGKQIAIDYFDITIIGKSLNKFLNDIK